MHRKICLEKNKKIVLFKYYDLEITLREIIFSLIIMGFMLIIGFAISNNVQEKSIKQIENYNTALQIKDIDVFEYGMKTNVGNAFICGNLHSLDPVEDPMGNIKGKYMYIKRIKYEYTMHTRIVSNGKTTRIETYYTWDEKGKEEYFSNNVTFLEHTFKINKFDISNGEHSAGTYKVSSTVKYKYVVVNADNMVTIYTNLKNNTISKNNSIYYKNIDKTKSDLIAAEKHGITIFWIIYIFIMLLLIFGFYALDNYWLE